ncbi:NUDIX domain-containing protein [Lederbergia citrisecunda]|uniref:NUDIX hydrolase n=1 Tax=Lederbergia citrisecunda TaxID=2833583 RepID=UPI003D2CE2CD
MEFWDIYDKNRIKTGRMHERGTPIPDGDYHLVVSIWIINSRQEILLAKRHPEKLYPNMWECPGGSALAGENSLEAALREVKEEIGIDLSSCNGELMKSERRMHNFRDVWLFTHDFSIEDTVLQPEEVIDAKWVTILELESLFNEGVVVPSLRYYKSFFFECVQRQRLITE